MEGGEVLDIRLEFGEAARLHYFQSINFTAGNTANWASPKAIA